MPSETELAGLVAQLAARVAQLEAQVADLRANALEVPEDVMIAIAAAVSAYTGYRGKVKAVRFASGRRYVQEARGRLHDRSVR